MQELGGECATVYTMSASNVTATGATLTGQVNPNSLLTRAWFEWGTTTSFGNTTPIVSAGSGSANVPISRALAGLSTGITYHYRLVGTNSAGRINGLDGQFTAGSALAAPAPAAPANAKLRHSLVRRVR